MRCRQPIQVVCDLLLKICPGRVAAQALSAHPPVEQIATIRSARRNADRCAMPPQQYAQILSRVARVPAAMMLGASANVPAGNARTF